MNQKERHKDHRNLSYITLKGVMLQGESALDKFYSERLVKDLINRMDMLAPYGKAAIESFGNMAHAMACLFAYNNKQYFVYKAIENPNKIGYLSAKKYLKLKALQWHLDKENSTSSERKQKVREFLKENGSMASAYRFFKKAFKENPEKTRWLSRFFPLREDGKCSNEKIFINTVDAFMQSFTTVQLEKAPIQDCYNVDLGPSYAGSGSRFATSSCMYRKNVQPFYDAFGAEGYIVKYRGTVVGRFLRWKLDDGEYYIDRLYCSDSYAKEVLAEIDKLFYKDWKFPVARMTTGNFTITVKHPELLIKKRIRIPYTDSFQFLYYKEGKGMFLSNKKLDDTNHLIFKCIDQYAVKEFSRCEACGAFMIDDNLMKHKMMCEKYVPANELERTLIAINKIIEKKGGETDGTRQRELNTLFGLQIPVATEA